MTTPLVTILIPYAPYHERIYHQAVASAERQTIPCKVISDLSIGTPATFRNTAKFADTDFVCFLDADDTIAPTFVEECIKTYQTATYVYTAWQEGERVMTPRECNPYLAHDFGDERGVTGGYHLVTTLFPTALFKMLGGFDTELAGMEDTDFYMRAQAAGICGVLCDLPLLNYNGDGETRSKAFRERLDYHDLRRSIYDRNGGLETMAGCCGIVSGGQQANLTGEQPGDVPAQTLYAPSTQFGRATGRFYPRPQFMGQTIMVAPADVELMPDMFRKLADLRDIAPTREKVLKESGLI